MRTSIFQRRERTSPAVAALMLDLERRARDQNPERYAPNGEALINYPGTTWTERRAAWYLEHGYPTPIEVPA